MATATVSRAVPVTVRQTEVIRGIARGLTNREIADELGIADRTVKSHVEQLKYKFVVRHRRLLPGALLNTGIDPYPRPWEVI